MCPSKLDEALQSTIVYGWFKLSLVDLNGASRISGGLSAAFQDMQSSMETFELSGIVGARLSLKTLVGTQGSSV